MSGLLRRTALRDRLLLKQRQQSITAAGAVVVSYRDMGSAWGRVRAERATLRPGWDLPVRLAHYDVTLRRRDDLKEGDALGWRGLLLVIGAILPDANDGGLMHCVATREVTLT